jgi:hypothetical protein
MPGAITGVPPPGAMPMVAQFALPSVPRKLRLIIFFYLTLFKEYLLLIIHVCVQYVP